MTEKLLATIAEDAIQIAHRIQGATDLLALHRRELAELCTRLGDTAVPEQEQWKRDTLAMYRTTLEQVDAALAVLGGKVLDGHAVKAIALDQLQRDLAILTGDDGSLPPRVVSTDNVRSMLHASAANIGQALGGRVVGQ
jgi:hypothetical protein